jgi:FkbM family methyltransferase
MPAAAILTMVDGVRVAVHDSLDQVTAYVLREQGDWFEDEIRFLRRLLEPGQQVIDIGANCGVYALSMARVVGPTGRVWAFEPASATADLLAEGAASNGFANVVVERHAVSATTGNGRLAPGALPEMNAVCHDPVAAEGGEVISLVSLDDCMASRGWRDIAFIKIDAEGEEANVLAGGRRLLTEQSPLVQYELQRDGEIQLDLVDAFATLGYDAYRLAPGPGMLVPFRRDAEKDAFQLNLFACKPDRAARLAAAGLLIGARAVTESQEWIGDIAGQAGALDAWSWRHTLATLPYGAVLAARWEAGPGHGRHPDVQTALAFHAYSRDPDTPAADRYTALGISFQMFGNLCAAAPSHLRLSSLARTARECGHRTIAIHALMRLSRSLLTQGPPDLGEPFLAPGERFDAVAPGADPGRWILAAVLEELERLNAWSSYFQPSLDRLRLIRDLGFASDEMQRRLTLVETRGMTTPA